MVSSGYQFRTENQKNLRQFSLEHKNIETISIEVLNLVYNSTYLISYDFSAITSNQCSCLPCTF